MRFLNETEELVKGYRTEIGVGTRIAGGKIVLSDDVHIGRDVDIEVSELLTVGKGAQIRDGTIIHGRHIELGREFYANRHAEIGGGSCFEKTSSLKIGYWFHVGSYSMINTAMSVTIGNEVGLGRFTNLYTHGAYLSLANGFPVQFGAIKIGNRVWLPSATVNPGVTIGDDVVVGVGSVVTKSIPSNSLAIGIPARVVKDNYPTRPGIEETMTQIRRLLEAWKVRAVYDRMRGIIGVAGAAFNVPDRTIDGPATEESERTKNLLRRIGIRFRYEVVDGVYAEWKD